MTTSKADTVNKSAVMAKASHAGTATVESAREALRAEERKLEEARAELEAAVAVADIEAVMRLRMVTEVQAPQAVAAARIAVIDAEVEQLQADRATGDAERRKNEAKAEAVAAVAAFKAAQQVLQDAGTTVRRANARDYEANQAWLTGPRRIAELRKKRDQLVATTEAEIAARIRALAGLEPLPKVDPPQVPTLRQWEEGIYATTPTVTHRQTSGLSRTTLDDVMLGAD